jgi:multiple sugar transport system ATP-binding protein
MTMSNRIVIMATGKVVQVDNPQNIFRRPANLFVAGFVGSPTMNMFECSLVKKDDKTMLDAGTFTYEMDPEMGKTVMDGATSSEIVLGVRPTDIAIRLEKRENSIPAEVYVTEPLGDQLLVDFKLGEDVYKAFASADLVAAIGDRIFLEFNREKIHVFDRKTEVALL